jgi:hypothetical protein
MPTSILDSDVGLDQKRETLVASHLKEDTNTRLDPDKRATIVVLLPIVNEQIGISLNIDDDFGFPSHNGADPSSPLRTHILMSVQRTCWIIAMSPKTNRHIKPVASTFCIDKLHQY